MPNIKLKQEQANFEEMISKIIQSKKEVLKFRNKFVKYFNKDKISKMTVQEYALGYEKNENELNFCYGLETQLKALGWMIGGTSRKFGVWYGIEKNDTLVKFRIVKKLGTKNKQAALNKIRKAILDLLKAGKIRDIEAIRSNILSPMFKGKILSTYYPEKYLNIFSKKHLLYYVNKLNIITEEIEKKDEVELREVILDYKNKNEIYSKWSVDIFVDSLIDYYGSPKIEEKGSQQELKEQSTSQLKKYKRLVFPIIQKPELINLKIESLTKTTNTLKKKPNSIIIPSPNYELDNIRNNQIGERGEKVVMDFEKERLKQFPKLIKKIKQVSLTSNHYGYDIKSFNDDETPRYIEVKTTTSKIGDANFFLTINELNKAKELENYCIYIVYEISSSSPKIWILGNPFNPENKKISLIPFNFKVSIKVNKFV